MNLPQPLWIEPSTVRVPLEFEALHLPPVVLETLVRRGINQMPEAISFLNPGKYQPSDPTQLPGLSYATDRILKAVREKTRITIWGDFDVDGQTATAILAQTLSAMNANFETYIPVRSSASHGLNIPALADLIQTGSQLILTCDCGIASYQEVEFALQAGVETVITDHHALPQVLPRAHAVVNPQFLPPDHPLYPLCGAGTAYMLACELLHRYGKPEVAPQLLDLVALGSVADVAQLTGENRSLVQKGLGILRTSPRPAFKAILKLNSLNPAQVNEEHLGFILGPRLNAVGRLADSNPIVSFLLSNDQEECDREAQELENTNNRRKLLCDQVFNAVVDRLERDRNYFHDPILILDQPGWPSGVIGIVAGKVAELYHRPVVLIAVDSNGIGRASARSINGINITSALSINQHLLLGFGGHPMAAGFSINQEKITDFRRAMVQTINSQVAGTATSLDLSIDSFVRLDQLNLDLVDAVEKLAPFGPGNSPILFACSNLAIKSHSPIGKSKEHLQLVVEDTAGMTAKVIWWQGAGSPLPGNRFDLAFTARASTYRGQRAVQLVWKAYRQNRTNVEVRTLRFVEIFDCRQCEDQRTRLSSYLNQPGTYIWREGFNDPPLAGYDRYSLKKCERLVLWNIPPGRAEIKAIMSASCPSEVVIFAVPSGSDSPNEFIRRLAGLLRYIINKDNGRSDLKVLTAAMAAREIEVQTGLAWLAAKGQISVQNNGNLLIIGSGGDVDETLAGSLEFDLRHMLSETRAFRALYTRGNPAHLLEV